MKITLHITGPNFDRVETVYDELSIGRTAPANIVIDDAGLSRKNTTFFIDDGELWAADENSTNGTFVNGDRLSGPPRKIRNGDRLTLGNGTNVSVEISSGYGQPSASAAAMPPPQTTSAPAPAPRPANANKSAPAAKQPGGVPMIAIASVIATFSVLLLGGVIIFLLTNTDNGPTANNRTTPAVRTQASTASDTIPIRVIDPLGGEDEDDLDDLIASWEVAEQEINASDVSSITGAAVDDAEFDLNVSAEFLAERQRLAFEPRPGEGGIRPAGLNVPKELFGDGVIKQKQKLAQMNSGGYRQPLDFADLAEKRMSGELVEMPMAAESFYLDVGGSAQDLPFSFFTFKDNSKPLTPDNPKYETLSKLANNFAGQKYDLNNAADRKQMRRRLLRMFQPRARPILKELADAYYGRFKRPLRVTSLTRSMDYQILLNSNNANSFKVRGEGSLPPHTSGCAFDLARKHMPVEEQNFVMAKLAEMERDGKLDALIEYGTNACFHVFIYHDGNPPGRLAFAPTEFESFPFLTGIRLIPE